MNRKRTLGALTALVSGAALWACASITNDVCDYPGACSADGSVAPGDSGADVIPSCDPQKDVTCISEEKGVFVKAGAQGGDGTRAKPFGKIQDGIEAATAAKFRVYVCEGDYAETVSIKKTVGIYGGLVGCDATTWTPTPGRVSRVKAAAGYALDASGGSIELTDLSFTAPDFAGQTETTEGTAGKSSIAAFVHSGADVQAKRTSFIAQGGGNAKATMAAPADSAAGGVGGTAASGAAGGAGGTLSCAAVDVSGGKGGTGGSSIKTSQSVSGMPTPSSGLRGCNGSAENMAGPCQSGAACGNGINGVGGSSSAAGASTSPAKLEAAGLSPLPGVSGGSGGHGNGGGGGGGDVGSAANHGGGGGAGGCGGAGGKGGGAGGASVAVVVHDAGFACAEGCSAKAGIAGKGGKGQKGQDGGMGGNAGGATGVGLGCNGAFGGGGAGGQGGQGGAAGLASGIVFGGSAKVSWAGRQLRIPLRRSRTSRPAPWALRAKRAIRAAQGPHPAMPVLWARPLARASPRPDRSPPRSSRSHAVAAIRARSRRFEIAHDARIRAARAPLCATQCARGRWGAYVVRSSSFVCASVTAANHLRPASSCGGRQRERQLRVCAAHFHAGRVRGHDDGHSGTERVRPSHPSGGACRVHGARARCGRARGRAGGAGEALAATRPA